jgi:SAM-dependent methyltransferase
MQTPANLPRAASSIPRIDKGYHRRLPDDEPGQLGTSAWPAHAVAPEYAVARFATDPEFISDVVRFDLPRLGDVRGLDGVHLQCHIGTDTVSLARLGARMTGLDFSAPAVAEARRVAELAGVDAEFLEGEVDDAVDLLGPGRFDLVYTGVGALCWLPSVRRWAGVVAALLRPAGDCSSARGTRCCGLWTRCARTAC